MWLEQWNFARTHTCKNRTVQDLCNMNLSAVGILLHFVKKVCIKQGTSQFVILSRVLLGFQNSSYEAHVALNFDL